MAHIFFFVCVSNRAKKRGGVNRAWRREGGGGVEWSVSLSRLATHVCLRQGV